MSVDRRVTIPKNWWYPMLTLMVGMLLDPVVMSPILLENPSHKNGNIEMPGTNMYICVSYIYIYMCDRVWIDRFFSGMVMYHSMLGYQRFRSGSTYNCEMMSNFTKKNMGTSLDTMGI